MAIETRAYVISLLESYHERINQIALLHYELEYPANVSSDEMIGAMSLGHGDGATRSKGHISNKTLYIALNYQEQTDRANAEVREEVVDRLIALEREQERLAYYIALLKDTQQETVIKRFYFEGRTWSDIAQELNVVTRTVHKIKNRALDRLVAMYTFADRPQP